MKQQTFVHIEGVAFKLRFRKWGKLLCDKFKHIFVLLSKNHSWSQFCSQIDSKTWIFVSSFPQALQCSLIKRIIVHNIKSYQDDYIIFLYYSICTCSMFGVSSSEIKCVLVIRILEHKYRNSLLYPSSKTMMHPIFSITQTVNPSKS